MKKLEKVFAKSIIDSIIILYERNPFHYKEGVPSSDIFDYMSDHGVEPSPDEFRRILFHLRKKKKIRRARRGWLVA